MGRRKQPINVIEMKGKKHLTKEEIRQRKKQEKSIAPKENEDIRPPDNFDIGQRAMFNSLVRKLKEYGIVTALEKDLLVRYILAKSEFNKITKELSKCPVTLTLYDDDGNEKLAPNDCYKDLINFKKVISAELRQCEVDLGLNFSSRLKMATPKEEKKEVSAFEKAFGTV